MLFELAKSLQYRMPILKAPNKQRKQRKQRKKERELVIELSKYQHRLKTLAQ